MDDVPACQNYLIVAFATEGMVLIGLSGFVNDCHCDNYKTIWNIIKLETNKSGISDKINTLNGEGNLIKNCQEIINIFNNYFSSIAKNIILTHTNQSNYKPYDTTPLHYLFQSFKTPFPNINLKSSSTKDVENVIKSLKPKNSYGYDGISTKLLKISSAFIISPLTYICNKSISLGIFPDRLKYAVVMPIFKKGDRSNITNYRPISMLSSF